MKCRAFSLVEVVLAMGIISFALVAMLGLFSVGLKAGKESGESTLVVSMASQVQGRLRSGVDVITVGQPADYYFTSMGKLLVDSANKPVSVLTAEAHYMCQVEARLPTDTEFSDSGNHLSIFTLTFRWPAVAADTSTSKEVLHVTIER